MLPPVVPDPESQRNELGALRLALYASESENKLMRQLLQELIDAYNDMQIYARMEQILAKRPMKEQTNDLA